MSNVNSPSHYGGENNPHEHVKCAEAWGLVNNAFLYNCTKYIARLGKKDPSKVLEDAMKARWYLDRYIKKLEEEQVVLHIEHAPDQVHANCRACQLRGQ